MDMVLRHSRSCPFLSHWTVHSVTAVLFHICEFHAVMKFHFYILGKSLQVPRPEGCCGILVSTFTLSSSFPQMKTIRYLSTQLGLGESISQMTELRHREVKVLDQGEQVLPCNT